MSGGPFSPKTTQANPTSIQNTIVDTRNDNVSGNSGVTAVGGDNSSLNLSVLTSDFGAVKAGADLANAGVSLGARGVDAGAYLGSQGINAAVTSATLVAQVAGDSNNLAAASYHDAAQFVADNSASTTAAIKSLASHSLDVNSALAQSASDNAKDYVDQTTTFAHAIIGQFGTTLANYQIAEQAQLGNTVSALNASYRDANTSSDQRIQDIAQSSQDLTREIFKYIAIAAAVAAVAFAARKGLPR